MRRLTALTLLAIALPVPPAAADDVGYDQLVARLGAAVPTGANVSVSQVEAQESAGNYGPNRTAPEFAGKIFSEMSGASGNSGHATTVAQAFYGTGQSIAPGIPRIWLYEAGSFCLGASLNVGGALPLTPPGGTSPVRVINHSWIGSFGDAAADNEALRRADYAMVRDDTLFVCGENNGAGSPMRPLMACNFNGIAVGLMSGAHSAGPTPAAVDGAGRMKPDLVAPGTYTSFSTPVVSAAAALMYDATNVLPYSLNGNRRRGVTIKSALMCGATHGESWSNQAPASGPDRGVTVKPLDPVFGAGTVNVDRAHRILTANEAFGSSTAAGAAGGAAQPLTSWDYEVFTLNYQRHYRFDVAVPCDASILLAWNRSPGSTFSVVPGLMNLRLELRKVVGGVPTAITGDAGASAFAGGNVLSASAVDNVEHLFIRGLQPGTYVLSVTRDDAVNIAAATAVSWMFAVPVLLGDLDGNGQVNGVDLSMLLGAWGTAGPGDLDASGSVDGGDLSTLLGNWS